MRDGEIDFTLCWSGANYKDLDVVKVRASMHRGPLRPYENFDIESKFDAKSLESFLGKLLTEGWSLSSGAIPSIVAPIQWDGHDRSFMFHLHAWEPVNLLLRGFELSGSEIYFETAIEFALDWLTREMPKILEVLTEKPRAEGLDLLRRLSEDDHNFRWYDMAVGQRLYRIAYILDRAARTSATPDSTIKLLYRSMMTHFAVLSHEKIFRAKTNHGVYQALCQLAAARRFSYLPDVDTYLRQAVDRSQSVVDAQFFDTGCHREHSPGYHFMILNTFINARSSGIFTDELVGKRILDAEDILSWMIKPNGVLVNIGDTDSRNANRGRAAAYRYENSHLQYLVSGGTVGVGRPTGVLAMLKEGYCFAKSGVSTAKSWWYLAQTAGFHSRTHKQADDLSFVWSDRGQDILIDPGRYGYSGKTQPGSALFEEGFWYSDPKRIYVESTRAHNAVEIDGRSYSRRRKPYGSALIYGGQQNDLIVTESEVHHFRTVRHWRVLILSPGHFLAVVDWLFDRSGMTHDFRQYFQFSPEWIVEEALPAGLRLKGPSNQVLSVLALVSEQGDPVAIRGQEMPQLQGWHSDHPNSLAPSISIKYEQLNSSFAAFATLFTFSNHPRRNNEATFIRRSMRPTEFSWRENAEAFTLSVNRSASGEPVGVTLVKGHRPERV